MVIVHIISFILKIMWWFYFVFLGFSISFSSILGLHMCLSGSATYKMQPRVIYSASSWHVAQERVEAELRKNALGQTAKTNQYCPWKLEAIGNQNLPKTTAVLLGCSGCPDTLCLIAFGWSPRHHNQHVTIHTYGLDPWLPWAQRPMLPPQMRAVLPVLSMRGKHQTEISCCSSPFMSASSTSVPSPLQAGSVGQYGHVLDLVCWAYWYWLLVVCLSSIFIENIRTGMLVPTDRYCWIGSVALPPSLYWTDL